MIEFRMSAPFMLPHSREGVELRSAKLTLRGVSLATLFGMPGQGCLRRVFPATGAYEALHSRRSQGG
ncbi:hypothetical protein BDFB_011747 [Asbolus verrucosus]|uniref:Uncharacterized protein n=1 Tax=Asbolus verrucosus TaxID=1661398 RepID=A0A482W795_ASBVE|nr:hypothetical protein BDFB_011747 [Asbolus verrucosus]